MSSDRKLRVVYLPVSDNPYQTQLANHLINFGVDVKGIEVGMIPLFIHKLINKRQTDIIHLHWVDPFFLSRNYIAAHIKYFMFLIQFMILKLLGIKIVWTMHNSKNHFNKYLELDKKCRTKLITLSSAIIVHCNYAKKLILSNYKNAKPNQIHVVQHGNYIDAYKNELIQSEARSKLGLSPNDLIFLFIGKIRPNKGILELINVFKNINAKNIKLIIVGQADKNSNKLIFKETQQNDKIITNLVYIPDNDIQTYLNSCDVVVLPYEDVLLSGVAILAMSFGKTCITPRAGCIKEIIDENGSFFFEPRNLVSLSNAIKEAIKEKDNLPNMGSYNLSLAKKWNWHSIAERTIDIYHDSLSNTWN